MNSDVLAEKSPDDYGNSSDGESFHSTLDASEDDDACIGSLEEQKTHTSPPLVGLSASDKVADKNPTGQNSPCQHCTTEKAVEPQTQSFEPPRKRQRSQTLTGPNPPIPRRRSSIPIHRKGQDLISFHRQSCRLFQSLEGTLASSTEWVDDINEQQSRYGSLPNTRPSSSYIIKTENGFAYLTSTTSLSRFTSPKPSRRNSITLSARPQTDPNRPPLPISSSSFTSFPAKPTSILEEKHIYDPSSDPTPVRPQPVSIISWTSTENRRREYEKIDRSYSGLRGLWKRMTPRWCHGKCARRAFFEEPRGASGGSSDAGSVRRYRMPLDDDDDEGYEGDEKMGLTRTRTETKGKGGMWSCLSLVS